MTKNVTLQHFQMELPSEPILSRMHWRHAEPASSLLLAGKLHCLCLWCLVIKANPGNGKPHCAVFHLLFLI